MLQNIINGVLGAWVIALAFLGFSDSLRRFLLIFTGLAIAVVSFYGKYLFKSTEELAKHFSEEQPKDKPADYYSGGSDASQSQPRQF